MLASRCLPLSSHTINCFYMVNHSKRMTHVKKSGLSTPARQWNRGVDLPVIAFLKG